MIDEAIGTVQSPVEAPVDADWGNVESTITLVPELAAGLDGLDGFSHALVVFFLDQATFEADDHLTRRPQGREDMPELGIFAQRAKHRPNPIGVTAVEVLGVEDGAVTVRGLDAIDGTPVLDVKPYVPAFDEVDDPEVPEWMDRLMVGYF